LQIGSAFEKRALAATDDRGSMRVRVGREKFEGGSGKGEARMGGSETEGRRGVWSEIDGRRGVGGGKRGWEGSGQGEARIGGSK
jgi:hypothetical protein